MLVRLIDKQRRAADVIKTALVSAGMPNRSIAVNVDSWINQYGRHENYAVFVSAPVGSDIEPLYVTGNTLPEAVRNMIDSIKGKTKNGANPDDQSEEAPF